MDATATIVEQYVKASSLNIRLINLPVNSGVSAVRNRCLKEAKGTAFYFVDADDWLEKECLQNYMTECLKNIVIWLFAILC